MKVKKLWLVVIVIEIVNALLSYLIGGLQANQCPRDATLPLISVLLSLTALVAALVLSVQGFKSRRWPIFIASIICCILIVCAGFVLWFIAFGGLDWCNFHF